MPQAPDWVAKLGFAILGALLGYFASALRKRSDDTKRRSAVATALLVELRWLERMLRRRSKHEQAAESTVRIEPVVYDRFEPDIVLFEAETVRLLLHFRGLIRDIELSQRMVETNQAEPDGRMHHFFRVKSAYAAQMIPRLRLCLLDEGGLEPPDDPLQTVRWPAVPELPPPAFPEASASA